MRYIYKNITATSRLLSLVSQDSHSVSHVPIGAGTTIELSYPGLDLYLPHILARLNEGGQDITHLVLRSNAVTQAAKTASKLVANKPVAQAAPASAAGMTTAVKPGVYVENNKSVAAQVAAEAAATPVPAPAVTPEVVPPVVAVAGTATTETPAPTTTPAPVVVATATTEATNEGSTKKGK